MAAGAARADIASGREGAPRRSTPDGRLSFTRQTPVEIDVTGETLELILGPEEQDPGSSRFEAFVERHVGGWLERHVEATEHRLQALEAEQGPVPERRTLTVTFTSDCTDGLVAAIEARARAGGLPCAGA